MNDDDDVPASLTASPARRGVAGLGVEAQRVLVVLAAVSGADALMVPVPVVAALADLSSISALRHLRHLVRCAVAEQAVGGYRIPVGLFGSVEPVVLDARAWARAGDWCMAGLFVAASVLGSVALPGAVPTCVEHLPVPVLPDCAAALEWYSCAYPVLTRVVRQESEHGRVEAVWRIALLMLQIDVVAGPGLAWSGVVDLGLAAARRVGDTAGESMLGEYRGKALLAIGEIDAARSVQDEVFNWRAVARDERGLVRSYSAIGLVELRAGNLAEAEPLFRKALEKAEELEFVEFATYARLNLGAVLAHGGASWEAEQLLKDAAHELRKAGRANYEADAVSTLAGLYRRRGRFKLAMTTATRAVEIAEQAGLPLYLAAALTELAAAQKAAGEVMESLAALREARLIYLGVEDELRAGNLAAEITAIGDAIGGP